MELSLMKGYARMLTGVQVRLLEMWVKTFSSGQKFLLKITVITVQSTRRSVAEWAKCFLYSS
jgi:hypothetical protein